MTEITIKTNNTLANFVLCDHITVIAAKSDECYEYIETIWMRCEVCDIEHSVDIEVA